MPRTAYLTRRKNKVTELTLLGFKKYCKATAVKIVWDNVGMERPGNGENNYRPK